MEYIKPCAACGESNLMIKVVTTKNAQFYGVICPKCGKNSMLSNVLEHCIDDWNEQAVE